MDLYVLVDPTLPFDVAVVSIHATQADAECAARKYAAKHAPMEVSLGYQLAYSEVRVRDRLRILSRALAGQCNDNTPEPIDP